jgi:hypothetical protein
MAWLAAFLTAFFGKLFEAFADLISKKIAMGGALVMMSLLLLTGFWVALKALVAGLIHQVANQQLLMAFYALWPSNAELCISAYWTAQLVAFIYREHRENLRAISYVT